MKFVLWVCCLYLIMPSVYVAGDYVVEVLVQSYNNPTHQSRERSGRCCDQDRMTDCNQGCDNRFTYCLRDLNTRVITNNRSCHSSIMTSQVNSNAGPIDFTQPTVLGLPNPLILRRSGAWEGTQLYGEVNDQDGGHDVDLVDVFTINIENTTIVGANASVINQIGVYGYGVISFAHRVLCAENYYGQSCQFLDTVNQCALNSVTCNGLGTCADGTNTYTCNCESGFTGRDCEVNINECEGQSCNGRGTCADGTNTYTCNCESGFTGRDCETNINECEGQSCNGRGTCQDLVNDYRCDCQSGYTGSLCETDINDCVGQNCSGNGQCVDGVNSFSCDCDTGYTGTLCETDIDDCVGVNCSGNGQCVDDVNTFSCDCDFGYNGTLCENIVDGCIDSNYCTENGFCVLDELQHTSVSSFRCYCDPGYTGTRCEVDINDCVDVNCSGNGQCVDGVNNFTCVCQFGFTGNLCSVETQGSSSIGEIVGGVVGSLVVLMLAILLVLLFLNLVKNKHQATTHSQGLNDAGADHIETKANMVYGFSRQGMNDAGVAGADGIETNTNIVYGVSQQGSGEDQAHYYDYIDRSTIVRELAQGHIEMKNNIGYGVH